VERIPERRSALGVPDREHDVAEVALTGKAAGEALAQAARRPGDHHGTRMTAAGHGSLLYLSPVRGKTVVFVVAELPEKAKRRLFPHQRPTGVPPTRMSLSGPVQAAA
jgi:hypothetical protein